MYDQAYSTLWHRHRALLNDLARLDARVLTYGELPSPAELREQLD